MDDFNAELLKSQERATEFNLRERIQDMADTHDRLRGATVEYHKDKPLSERMMRYVTAAWPILQATVKGWADETARLEDDRYLIHGVLARLMGLVDDTIGVGIYEAEDRYHTGIEEIINTLTSYLSQG